MKQKTLNTFIIRLRICILAFILTMLSFFLFSFKINGIKDDFFSQLGIDKTGADQKICNSLLGGYLDAYGLKNAKNITLGNRTAVVKDLLEYTHQYTGSAEFKKAYYAVRLNNKPVPYKLQTPDEMRKDMIESYRKSITEMESAAGKADASTKKIFENVVADSKKQLKEAEDPNNPIIASYAESYPQLEESAKQSYAQQLEEWESLFPENGMLFVKKRLNKFLELTKDIDYNAQLTTRNGKQVFVNPVYEKKSKNWKMAFRAGKEVVDPTRAYVTQWVNEIK